MAGPLSGLKVLDIGTVLAAPLAGTYLADLGAEVVKIEHPKGDSIRKWGIKKGDTYLLWKVVNRNKKDITLNLSVPKGQELFKRLSKDTDVIIENFRPGTMDRWGLGFDDLRRNNPKLIMVSISGWGQSGPYRHKPGYGTLAEGMSGFAQLNGPENGPPTLPPVGMADAISGLFAAYAALSAIYHRDRTGTGRGQHVDVSLYESLYTLLGFTSIPVTQYDQLEIISHRLGNRTNFECPRNLYRTSDNRWISISSTNENMARRIFLAMEMGDILEVPGFRNNDERLKNVEKVDQLISEWMSKHSSDEVLQVFEKNEATAAIVYDVKDMFNDQHFRARGNIVSVPDQDLGHIKMHGIFPIFDETPGIMDHSALPLGYDNKKVYCESLGLTEDELKALERENVV